MVKRITDDKNHILYSMIKDHDKQCMNSGNKSEDKNILDDYKIFISKCNAHLDKTDYYNKQDLRNEILDIYNKNNFKFSLKDNTINNIINTIGNLIHLDLLNLTL